MGEAFIVRRGGAGGLSPSKAVLHIIAEANSTITLEKGGVTVTTLGPEKSHVNADDNTLADWYYAIGAGNYGSWTVTAEKSGDTGSDTVTVDSNKQYDVRVRYAYYVIKHGKVVTGNYTTNIVWPASGQSDGLAEETTVGGVDYYRIFCKGANRQTSCYFTPKQLFPMVGGYTDLVISCRSKGGNANSNVYGAASNRGAGDATTSPPTWGASKNVGTAQTSEYTPLETFTLDISGLSGEYWVEITTTRSGGSTYNGDMLVRDLYFTKS